MTHVHKETSKICAWTGLWNGAGPNQRNLSMGTEPRSGHLQQMICLFRGISILERSARHEYPLQRAARCVHPEKTKAPFDFEVHILLISPRQNLLFFYFSNLLIISLTYCMYTVNYT